ncbi:universal stress protein [Pseudonocardia sp. NPDC049154]|uniref:universal stress protein n=1 Tax=Pseudonocardia sp. NPDC049154 TaxID=3155501 RepID=UPI0033F5FFBF
MSYRTILVGTDGSDTSLRAVDRAAELADAAGARLVIATAYRPSARAEAAADVLKDEAHLVRGAAPADDDLRAASSRVEAVVPRARVDVVAAEGEPVDVLVDVARAQDVDLLVVGNRGLGSLAGRVLGSVPSEVARRAGVDVLIVHTT